MFPKGIAYILMTADLWHIDLSATFHFVVHLLLRRIWSKLIAFRLSIGMEKDCLI